MILLTKLPMRPNALLIVNIVSFLSRLLSLSPLIEVGVVSMFLEGRRRRGFEQKSILQQSLGEK